MRIFVCVMLSLLLFLSCVFLDKKTVQIVGDKRESAPNSNEIPPRLAPKAPAPSVATPYGLVRRVHVGERKVVALTFDFCELATKTTGYNVELVRYLQKNTIPATLFLGGKWLRSHKERGYELLNSELFEIANHAWAHGNFALLDEQGMQEQVEWMQVQYELMQEELSRKSETPYTPTMLTLFRFPYGRSSAQALEFLQQKGLLAIQWDVVGEMRPNNAEPYAVQEVLQQVRPGSILLFHGNRVPKGTEVLVPRVIERLQAQGYSFVTVGQLLTMGEPELVEDGYFLTPGDNHALDTRFGIDGTGAKK